MSDIEKYIAARKARNPKAWADFDQNYRRYAIGMLLDGTNVNEWMLKNNYAVPYLGENKELVQEAHKANKQKLIERGELPKDS